MTSTEMDTTAELREFMAGSHSRPGFHPYHTTLPIVTDEPLWAISVRAGRQGEWLGPYRTATRDLDQAIDEAREHLRAPMRAAVSVLPTVPRSETYRSAKDFLVAMMLAVPAQHRQAGAMFDQLQAALGAVIEAEKDGRYFGGLKIDLPIALDVREGGTGRLRSVKTVSWGMDCGGDWPEWNRCTARG
jgi:hypothetical protein